MDKLQIVWVNKINGKQRRRILIIVEYYLNNNAKRVFYPYLDKYIIKKDNVHALYQIYSKSN